MVIHMVMATPMAIIITVKDIMEDMAIQIRQKGIIQKNNSRCGR
jgi:hypothetical protein